MSLITYLVWKEVIIRVNHGPGLPMYSSSGWMETSIYTVIKGTGYWERKTMWFRKAKGQLCGQTQKMGKVWFVSVKGKAGALRWEALFEKRVHWSGGLSGPHKVKRKLENWLSVEWALTCFLTDVHSSVLYSFPFSGLGGIHVIPIAQASKLAPCPVLMISIGLGKFKSVRCEQMFSGKFFYRKWGLLLRWPFVLS